MTQLHYNELFSAPFISKGKTWVILEKDLKSWYKLTYLTLSEMKKKISQNIVFII